MLGKLLLVLLKLSHNSGAIDVKMDRYILEEKSSFEMLGLSFSSTLDWGSNVVSIARFPSKIGALICSMKLLSPEVTLYLYKSITQPGMEYCYHIWVLISVASATWIHLTNYRNRYVCPSLTGFLAPLPFL